MKKILIVLWLLNSFFLVAENQTVCAINKVNSIHIYLCSRLTEAAKKWNNEICQELNSEFCIFRPQDVDVSDFTPIELDWAAYSLDLEGMKDADLLLVLPPYGRDCAWEIGWFCGKQKPAIAYAEIEGDWLLDAMVKGGLTAIITDNALLYKTLLENPSTREKSHLIVSRKNLAEMIKKIYYQKIQEVKPNHGVFKMTRDW